MRRFSNEQAAPPKRTAAVEFRRPAIGESVETPRADDVDVNDAEGRLLSAMEQQNRLVTDLVRSEVENELRERFSLEGVPVTIDFIGR